VDGITPSPVTASVSLGPTYAFLQANFSQSAEEVLIHAYADINLHSQVSGEQGAGSVEAWFTVVEPVRYAVTWDATVLEAGMPAIGSQISIYHPDNDLWEELYATLGHGEEDFTVARGSPTGVLTPGIYEFYVHSFVTQMQDTSTLESHHLTSDVTLTLSPLNAVPDGGATCLLLGLSLLGLGALARGMRH